MSFFSLSPLRLLFVEVCPLPGGAVEVSQGPKGRLQVGEGHQGVLVHGEGVAPGEVLQHQHPTLLLSPGEAAREQPAGRDSTRISELTPIQLIL